MRVLLKEKFRTRNENLWWNEYWQNWWGSNQCTTCTASHGHWPLEEAVSINLKMLTCFSHLKCMMLYICNERSINETVSRIFYRFTINFFYIDFYCTQNFDLKMEKTPTFRSQCFSFIYFELESLLTYGKFWFQRKVSRNSFSKLFFSLCIPIGFWNWSSCTLVYTAPTTPNKFMECFLIISNSSNLCHKNKI